MSDIPLSHPIALKPLDNPHRYKVLYGGRGSGKSWGVARMLLMRGVAKQIRILCTRELQKSIKQSVHKLLSLQIDAMGLNSFYDINNDKIVGLNGTEFIFMGIKHNTEEIKSTEAIDICWIEEAHAITENSWDLIDPTIRKEGSEVWITYNTRFKFDHMHLTFVVNTPPPNSLVIKVNYYDNKWLPDVLEMQAKTMKKIDYDKYLNIWEGELKMLAEGAIFGKQITKVRQTNRLMFIPIASNCEVHTFWDLGKKDETAIWFMQKVGHEYRFIDYFEGRLEEVSYFSRFVKAQEYIYGTHYMPHDAAQERLGQTRTLEEQFNDGGVRPTDVVPRISQKMQAIELAREIFPECWFHRGNDEGRPDEDCEGFIPWVSDDRMRTRAKRSEAGYENLCNYRYKFIDDDGVFQKNPHHDKASNGADAFMQFAQCDININSNTRYDDWSQPING